jgi:hypothetical protein
MRYVTLTTPERARRVHINVQHSDVAHVAIIMSASVLGNSQQTVGNNKGRGQISVVCVSVPVPHSALLLIHAMRSLKYVSAI